MIVQPSDVYVGKSPLLTPCRSCHFASYKGDEQTGCNAGRLDVLRDRPGVTLELVTDPPGVSDPKSYYAIDGAICLYKRSGNWTGTAEDARKEMADGLKVRLFVIAEGEEETIATLEKLKTSRVSYWKVSVVPGRNPPKRSTVALWLRENAPWPYTVDWFWGEPRPAEDLIEDALAGCKSVYYAVAEGSLPPGDFLTTLTRRVVVEEQPIIATSAHGWYAVQTFAHGNIGGNVPTETSDGNRADSVLEKLSFASAKRGEALVTPWGEICG